jgi:hypothetical protein
MPLWFRIVRTWLPIAIALSAACGLAYVGVQQSFRMGANDPQAQLATDGAARLDAGGTESDIMPSETVNIARDLAPFVIVYSPNNGALLGSGLLEGAPPTPPVGVLNAARSQGRNSVTWQPRPGVRIASVSVAAKDGRVVLAGRNLRETEARIDRVTKLAGFAWIAGLLGTLAACWALEAFGRRWDPVA